MKVGVWLKPEYNKEGVTGLPDLSTHLRGRPKIEQEEKKSFLVPSWKDGKQEILVLVSKHKFKRKIFLFWTGTQD